MNQGKPDFYLHTEYWGRADRTVSVAKHYLSSDIADDTHEIVFVFNDQGYYSVYKNLSDIGSGENRVASFEREEDLDAYLQGNNPDSAMIHDNDPATASNSSRDSNQLF